MYYAGIDLGGTKVYSLIIDQNNKIISRYKIKLKDISSADKILDTVAECYKSVINSADIDENKIKYIGLAVPSSVNTEKGLLINAPNLKIKNIAINSLLSRIINKPVYTDNDVNMGTYGEYIYSLADKFRNIYGIFIGTGIGGGYICNGMLVKGKNYTAGEIGHMIIKKDGPVCGCGRKGCLEAIAGKLGVLNYIKKQIDEKKEKTCLDKICPDWRKGLGSSILKKCWLAGDSLVLKALKKSAKAVGIAAANIINTTGIEAIVIGGGLYQGLENDLFKIIKKNMEKYAIGDGAKGVKIIKSLLSDDAVAYGAAYYAAYINNNNKED